MPSLAYTIADAIVLLLLGSCFAIVAGIWFVTLVKTGVLPIKWPR